MTSPLLALPGELRNRIYHYAVVQHDIDVTPAGFDEPPLLLTCKIIRKEAGTIFYSDSTFTVYADHYDPTVPRLLTDKCAHVRAEFGTPEIQVNSFAVQHSPHWTNLLAWLKGRHSREIELCPYVADECGSADKAVISAMFCMVMAMRRGRWRKVRALLMEQRKALVRLDKRWADPRA